MPQFVVGFGLLVLVKEKSLLSVMWSRTKFLFVLVVVPCICICEGEIFWVM